MQQSLSPGLSTSWKDFGAPCSASGEIVMQGDSFLSSRAFSMGPRSENPALFGATDSSRFVVVCNSDALTRCAALQFRSPNRRRYTSKKKERKPDQELPLSTFVARSLFSRLVNEPVVVRYAATAGLVA